MKDIDDFKPNLSMVEFAKFKEESQVYLDEDKMHSNSNPIKPQRLMKDLRESLSRDAIGLSRAETASLGQHIIFLDSSNTFVTGLGFGSVGYATAAVVGAKFALPKKPVIAIVGDGAFLMNGMELATAGKLRYASDLGDLE